MVVSGRPMKRLRPRRYPSDPCDFLSFPSAEDAAVDLDGPFRSNVRAFLARHGRNPAPPPPAAAPHLLAWRVPFRVGGGLGAGALGEEEEEEEEEAPPPSAVVELDVIEEDVLRSKSIYCDQCRVVGWSGHPVCGKRYHFIIRNRKNALPGCYQQQTCVRCGSLVSLSDFRCISCEYEIKGHDVEDGVYKQLKDSTHLLHGVVHANGYGHLLRVNGREGGSELLSGFDIMGFWDRLCKMLRVRKVSVMDISKKHGMEYRLLNAVTSGHSWYGIWGYKFCGGSFALTAEAYQKAVETITTVPLSLFFSHTRCPRSALQNTISLYWSISDRPLVTVRDLFCYVTQLLHETRQPPAHNKKLVETALCPWSLDHVKKAEDILIKVLRAVGGSRWVARRALKGASCNAVRGDLIDYCLNGLGGRSADNGMQVAVRFNDKTKSFEYRLEPARDLQRSSRLPKQSADQILGDLKFLYDALLNPTSMQPYKPTTVREAARSSAAKLLDCKQFMKHYDEPTTNMLPYNPFVIGVWCHVELLDHPKDYTAPPAELLVLPTTATIADLKREATKAFQETYLIFQGFQTEELTGTGNIIDSDPVQQYFASNGVARIRGRCTIGDCRLGRFRKERGLESWVVDCTCGAKDDDGERMMACDSCGTWQHTRCTGIRDSDEVPARFICRQCASIRTKGRSSGLCFREAHPRQCFQNRTGDRTGRPTESRLDRLDRVQPD